MINRYNHFKYNQQGFLSLMAVFIIILFALLSSSLTYLFVAKTTSTSYLVSHNRAFSAAIAMKENGLYLLNQPTIASRTACSDLENSSILSLAGASASITANNFIDQSTTLSSLSGTTIVVDDSSQLADRGRIYIDREAIDYSYNDGVNTLGGIRRGAAGTNEVNHSANSIVSQSQCQFQQTGVSPSTTQILGRAITEISNQQTRLIYP